MFTATAAIITEETNTQENVDNELGDCTAGYVHGCQTEPESNSFAAQTFGAFIIKTESKENQASSNKMDTNKNDMDNSYCTIKLDSLMMLKDSTKKLLCLIENIQAKTKPATTTHSPLETKEDITIPLLNELTVHLEDLPETSSMKVLREHIKDLDDVEGLIEHTCTVYDKLTRKCTCLNRAEYNDLIIQFNSSTKYTTCDLGEVIKNIRILKKFLYMGGDYTKNALMFLNEGLTKSPHSEKVNITLACSHADLCNVFDDESYLKILIKLPNQFETFGDTVTQNLAARVLYRISVVEEGRRYLNFNSKIANDLKQILRKPSGKLTPDTIEFLNSTMNSLSPMAVPLVNSAYYKADEGTTKKILNSLSHFRHFMTLEEILENLALLNKLTDCDKGVMDIKENFRDMCFLFKKLLLQYNNSDMNIILTSILNKFIKRLKITDSKKHCALEKKIYTATDTATEPAKVKHQAHQAPSNIFRNFSRSVRSQFLKSRTESIQPSMPSMPSIAQKKTKPSRPRHRSRNRNSKKNLQKTKELQGSIIVMPLVKS